MSEPGQVPPARSGVPGSGPVANGGSAAHAPTQDPLVAPHRPDERNGATAPFPPADFAAGQPPGTEGPVVDLRTHPGPLFGDRPPPDRDDGAPGTLWSSDEPAWDPTDGWSAASEPAPEAVPGPRPAAPPAAPPAPPPVPAHSDDAQSSSPFLATPTPTPFAPAGTGERTPPPVAPSRGRSGHLARRLAVLAGLPLLILLVAAVLAVVVGSASGAPSSDTGAAAAQRAARTALDELAIGVNGLVASGVGAEVATSDEVHGLVEQVRRTGAAPELDLGTSEAEQAAATREGYAAAVDAALADSAGDPLVLGDRLAALDGLYQQAATADDELAVSLSVGGSAGRRGPALAVLLVGAVLAALAWLLAVRRMRRDVVAPIARLGDALRRIRAGELRAPSRVGGAPELAALGEDLDAAVAQLGERLGALSVQAEWGEQNRLILEALDLADDEESLFEVVTRAFAVIDPSRPVELLVSDRGPTRLSVVATNPNLDPPGSPVDGAAACVALRRGQVSVFESPSSINSCAMLRMSPHPAVAGVCVPVSVAGRPAGVIHMTGPVGQPPTPHVVDRLVSLASQVGTRLGALRTLESTRQEASTDGLTGLPNRRSLETEVGRLLSSGTPFVMVLADLDKFKRLNDNYGHEVGDKALQLFAGVLRDNVRGNDVVARLGGEEFVLVYPNISVEISIEAIGRFRAALARAVAASALPAFTCSFGIAHSSVAPDGDAILRIADAGLLRAKELGGDQAVFADADLAAAVFADGGSGGRGHRDDDPDPRR